jgi:hypothetical protein
MRKLIALLLIATPLAGCMQDPLSRGIAGGVLGAAIGDATDQNMVAATAIGAGLGAGSCLLRGTIGCN